MCLRLYILFLQDSYIRPIKKGFVAEISLDLIYILLCYFYLVHIIYYFYLTKINLFIYIPYPNKVYDKQRKNISQW